MVLLILKAYFSTSGKFFEMVDGGLFLLLFF